MRRLPALLAALLAALAASPAASAHAKLVSTSPRDRAIVSAAPAQIRVLFDDVVTVGPGNAIVRNGGGSALAGKPRVAADGRALILPVSKLPTGDYSVRWRVLSDDGHLEQGVFAFRVGTAGGAAPVSVLRAEGGRPSPSDVVSRWLYLGGILVAGGAALFRLAAGRIGGRAAGNAVAVALVAVFLGGSSLLHASGGSTRFGHVVQVAIVVALLGATAAAISTVYPRLLDAALLAGLVLLAAPSLGGHALDAGRYRPLAFSADLAHLAAAAFWIGGLVQLALLLRAEGSGDAARRFSRLALPAAALIGVTGILRALEELARTSQLWTTGYGRTIVAKSVLFAALLGLGWASRSHLAARSRLRRSVAAELTVLACVVGAVALLTALAPGRDVRGAQAAPKPPAPGRPSPPPAGALALARRSGDLAVAVAVQRKPLRLTATIVGPDGTGLDGLDVQLIAGAATSGTRTGGRPCGHGCYTGRLAFPSPNFVAVNFETGGRSRSVRFTVPRSEGAGTAFLRRAARSYRRARSVVYVERLTSGLGPGIVTTWKLAAPDRLSYDIHGGASGIVIGTRRWDRTAPGGAWLPSQTTRLPQPVPGWGAQVLDARVVGVEPGRRTVAWVNPSIPAWFEATFDSRTALPLELRMTAASHFMHHTYKAFDRPVHIVPPNE
jgi:copper transport protein